MDRFSTQYMPSNAGLVRATPAMRRALRMGDRVPMAVMFTTACATFFLVGLANSVLPRIWPTCPPALPEILGFALLGAILVGVILPWTRTRAVRRFDQLVPPTMTRLVADEAGVTFSDELSHGHWDWRHVRGAVVTPDGVAILLGVNGAFVPKSAFRNKSEQADFLALVNRRADRSGM